MIKNLFFTNFEALIFKRKFLVIADVHLGIEKEYFIRGINLPSQTERIINKIISLSKQFNIKHLIICGDFKHNVPKISYQELVEVPRSLQKLSEAFDKVYILKGNHDGYLQNMLPESVHNIKIGKELKIGDFSFLHGNRKPRFDTKIYVIGHNHPVYKFISNIGESFYEKVFVKGYFDDKTVVILPAFSNLAGGWEVGEFQGPIAKKIEKYEVYALDGTFLFEREKT